MHAPAALPELPDFLRGRSIAVIDGAFAGGEEAGAEAVAALRALEPELDTWGMADAAALSRLHMDPEEPMPYAGASTMLGALDDGALDAFLANVQPGSPVLFAELRQLGGALARIPEGVGAVGAFRGDYLFFTAGLVMEPEMAAAVEASGEVFLAALAPYESGAAYLNFVEHPTDTSAFFTDDAYARLRSIRAAVDPDGLMVGNHPIPAA